MILFLILIIFAGFSVDSATLYLPRVVNKTQVVETGGKNVGMDRVVKEVKVVVNDSTGDEAAEVVGVVQLALSTNDPIKTFEELKKKKVDECKAVLDTQISDEQKKLITLQLSKLDNAHLFNGLFKEGFHLMIGYRYAFMARIFAYFQPFVEFFRQMFTSTDFVKAINAKTKSEMANVEVYKAAGMNLESALNVVEKVKEERKLNVVSEVVDKSGDDKSKKNVVGNRKQRMDKSEQKLQIVSANEIAGNTGDSGKGKDGVDKGKDEVNEKPLSEEDKKSINEYVKYMLGLRGVEPFFYDNEKKVRSGSELKYNIVDGKKVCFNVKEIVDIWQKGDEKGEKVSVGNMLAGQVGFSDWHHKVVEVLAAERQIEVRQAEIEYQQYIAWVINHTLKLYEESIYEIKCADSQWLMNMLNDFVGYFNAKKNYKGISDYDMLAVKYVNRLDSGYSAGDVATFYTGLEAKEVINKDIKSGAYLKRVELSKQCVGDLPTAAKKLMRNVDWKNWNYGLAQKVEESDSLLGAFIDYAFRTRTLSTFEQELVQKMRAQSTSYFPMIHDDARDEYNHRNILRVFAMIKKHRAEFKITSTEDFVELVKNVVNGFEDDANSAGFINADRIYIHCLNCVLNGRAKKAEHDSGIGLQNSAPLVENNRVQGNDEQKIKDGDLGEKDKQTPVVDTGLETDGKRLNAKGVRNANALVEIISEEKKLLDDEKHKDEDKFKNDVKVKDLADVDSVVKALVTGTIGQFGVCRISESLFRKICNIKRLSVFEELVIKGLDKYFSGEGRKIYNRYMYCVLTTYFTNLLSSGLQLNADEIISEIKFIFSYFECAGKRIQEIGVRMDDHLGFARKELGGKNYKDDSEIYEKTVATIGFVRGMDGKYLGDKGKADTLYGKQLEYLMECIARGGMHDCKWDANAGCSEFLVREFKFLEYMKEYWSLDLQMLANNYVKSKWWGHLQNNFRVDDRCGDNLSEYEQNIVQEWKRMKGDEKDANGIMTRLLREGGVDAVETLYKNVRDMIMLEFLDTMDELFSKKYNRKVAKTFVMSYLEGGVKRRVKLGDGLVVHLVTAYLSTCMNSNSVSEDVKYQDDCSEKILCGNYEGGDLKPSDCVHASFARLVRSISSSGGGVEGVESKIFAQNKINVNCADKNVLRIKRCMHAMYNESVVLHKLCDQKDELDKIIAQSEAEFEKYKFTDDGAIVGFKKMLEKGGVRGLKCGNENVEIYPGKKVVDYFFTSSFGLGQRGVIADNSDFGKAMLIRCILIIYSRMHASDRFIDNINVIKSKLNVTTDQAKLYYAVFVGKHFYELYKYLMSDAVIEMSKGVKCIENMIPSILNALENNFGILSDATDYNKFIKLLFGCTVCGGKLSSLTPDQRSFVGNSKSGVFGSDLTIENDCKELAEKHGIACY